MIAAMGLINSIINQDRSIVPIVGNGSYKVSCADIMVADGEQGDNGIFARVFYPTDIAKESLCISERPLWLSRKEYVDGLASHRNISPRKMHIAFEWLVGVKRLAAYWHEPLSAGTSKTASPGKFPVVIFSHGLSACRLLYSTFCCSLASYGFVVAAVEHRDRSACWTYKLELNEDATEFSEQPILLRKILPNEDEFRIRNQQLHLRTTECVKLLHLMEELNLGQCGSMSDKKKGCKIIVGQEFDWSQFKSRLDMSKASIIGHSFGGATAIAASAFSTDFTSALILDGWMMPIEKELYQRCLQPTLFINAERFQWASNVREMSRICRNSSKNILLTMKEVAHVSFTDISLMIPTFISRKLGFIGKIEPERCLEAIVTICVQFIKQNFTEEQHASNLTFKQYSDFVIQGTTLNIDEE